MPDVKLRENLVKNNNVEEEDLQSKDNVERYTTDLNYRHVYVKKVVVAHAFIQLAALWSICLLIYQRNYILFSWAFVLGLLSTSIGVGLGAHRYYTHRSFKATRSARWLFILMHSLAGQNSMVRWVRTHRVHHWYSDTDGDPHNATRGFFFSHMGWLMTKPHPLAKQKLRECDVSDLLTDDIAMFQYKYFYALHFVVAFLIPVAIPLLWGESLLLSILGAYFARYAISLHITWSVNSVAHIWGSKPYDKRIRPTQTFFVWFISAGEGWHNFHHAFPWDSRITEYGQIDSFTNLVLDFLEKLGWIYDVKTVPPELLRRQVQKYGDGTSRWLWRVAQDSPSKKNSPLSKETDTDTFGRGA